MDKQLVEVQGENKEFLQRNIALENEVREKITELAADVKETKV